MFGNENSIMKDIVSSKPYLVINAIIDGTNAGIDNKEFIDAVKLQKGNMETIMNIPISSVAIASLQILGMEKYDGEDPLIKKLINSELKING